MESYHWQMRWIKPFQAFWSRSIFKPSRWFFCSAAYHISAPIIHVHLLYEDSYLYPVKNLNDDEPKRSTTNS